uniref:XPA C-terminal domain-containing protein n=1 Tax=Pinguiococcus pyrenoidosus TaxID=172671 RepID=A0A7R9U9T2_9STRA|mmetsp:Transcript_18246/g.69169  ORF Transcript_18246/g.69169 Transcript_18246/m.69169 type:complete len:424 (+) Transcript_18246:233-1504(+)
MIRPASSFQGLAEPHESRKRQRKVRWIESVEELGRRFLCNKTRALKSYGLDDADLQEIDVIQAPNPHHPARSMQLFEFEDVERLSRRKQLRKQQASMQRREDELEERLRRLARGKMAVSRLPECFREYVFGDYVKRLEQTKTAKQYGSIKKDYAAALRVAKLPPKWHKTWVLPYLRGGKERKREHEELEVLRKAFVHALADSERRLQFFSMVVFKYYVLQFLTASDVASLVIAYDKEKIFEEYSGIKHIPREYRCLKKRVRDLCGDAFDATTFDALVYRRGGPPRLHGQENSPEFCKMCERPFHPSCGILALARAASVVMTTTQEQRREMLEKALGKSYGTASLPPCVEDFIKGSFLGSIDEVEASVRLFRFCEEHGCPESFDTLSHGMGVMVVKETMTWAQASEAAKNFVVNVHLDGNDEGG